MGVKMLQCFPFYRRCKERCKSRQCPPAAGERQLHSWLFEKFKVDQVKSHFFILPDSLSPQFPSKRWSPASAPPHPGAVTARERGAWAGAPRYTSPPRPGCLSDTSWTATSTPWTPPTEETNRTPGLEFSAHARSLWFRPSRASIVTS